MLITSFEGRLPLPAPVLYNFHLSSLGLSIVLLSLKTINPFPKGDWIHFCPASSITICAAALKLMKNGAVNDCHDPLFFNTSNCLSVPKLVIHKLFSWSK